MNAPKKSFKLMLDQASRKNGDCIHVKSSTRKYEMAVHRLVGETILVLSYEHKLVAQYSTSRGLTFTAKGWQYGRELESSIEDWKIGGKSI